MIITIPYKTPTINHLYGQRGFRRFLKKEAVELKQKIIEIVKSKLSEDLKPLIEAPLKIRVEIFEDWFTLENRVAQKDISNREKFLIDSIFEGLGIDDRYIFEHVLIKRQLEYGQTEQAIVNIEVI